MGKYRKKPAVIEAIEWTGKNFFEIQDFVGRDDCFINICSSLEISTLEGDLTAKEGDMVIRGVQGEFYPCKPDIFKETYERIDG